MNKVKL